MDILNFTIFSALVLGQESGFESTMLANDKLYVVLTVVLIIWFGILFFLFRTDKKITALENDLNDSIFKTKEK